MNTTEMILDAITQAHAASKTSYQEMIDDAAYRDNLVRAALEAGITTATIAKTLGVNRQRIGKMVTIKGTTK